MFTMESLESFLLQRIHIWNSIYIHILGYYFSIYGFFKYYIYYNKVQYYTGIKYSILKRA